MLTHLEGLHGDGLHLPVSPGEVGVPAAGGDGGSRVYWSLILNSEIENIVENSDTNMDRMGRIKGSGAVFD